MNRIILAYANANADLAQNIDNQLSRIGIPFEHINSSSGNLPSALLATGEPILLLVTDNLLKERASMRGLLDALRQLPADITLLPVVADGMDEDGNPVVTQIDRMVNMLHYMNHWQNEWLNLSAAYQAGDAYEKSALELDLSTVRSISGQASDLIGLLREKGAMSYLDFSDQDFALFFKRFGLSDWHGQYRRLVAQLATHPDETESSIHLPEMPLPSGLISPEPTDPPVENMIKKLTETANETANETKPEAIEAPPEILFTEVSARSEEFETVNGRMQVIIDPIQQTIQDAHLWVERGHLERGLELLRVAAEEYPNDKRIDVAFQQLHIPQEVPPNIAIPEPEIEIQAPRTSPGNDAHSYDLMGDTAFSKGDFLFAKYCWERVLDVSPNHPDVFRKLGLMTAEHLLDYRETAVHYLKKALEINPIDEEVRKALVDLLGEHSPLQQPEPLSAEGIEYIPVLPDSQITEATPIQPEIPKSTKGTVLITGATSGIGRATAQLFAENGYRLILTGRREERLQEIKKQFESAYHTDILVLAFDIRDALAVQAALGNLPEAFQRIDVLVNNAGLAKGLSPIHEGILEHWETMIDTNLKGLLYVTKIVSSGMVARQHGHIINVCSSAGKEVYPNGNVYSATKFAVDALTKSMRLDLHTHNVRVSQVSPGHVEETEFALTRFDGDTERANIYSDFQPLKSWDVAEVIYFMATRPPHVNIQDVHLFPTQQASSTMIHRSGRNHP